MSWQDLIGHDLQQEMFRRASSRGRLGHAYLLTGTAGIGKRTFARLLAQALLCRNSTPENLEICDECPSCRQVLSGSHPDLLTAGLPEGKSELPIEVFVGSPEKRGREGLCHDLALSPMQGGYRIAIIDDADRMNVASSNALLKTLEEPGTRSILILIAADSDQVINTIRSRCQQVHFSRLAPNDLSAILTRIVEQQGEEAPDPQRLQRAVDLADGSVAKGLDAFERLRSGDLLEGEGFGRILSRPGFQAADLAAAGDVIFSKAATDTTSQREAGLVIVQSCLEHFHRQIGDPGQTPSHSGIIDRHLDALDCCFEAARQIDRKVNVPLCLDTFYHDLEMLLRPTWKTAADKS
ncbi:DNA polymerase III subunit [Rubinisphaera margarita]|uniref:DNA polymerase III subunit n=1 Tax=Rubinisphaera margarita TaxID=2909586 RepID=UPI001EE7FE2E|nr:DNA polymerase III subunit [Rubinisphaera margarita]MCG6155782.1 DNA polymerase III subunit [Rubinisphaera margarita]